MKTLIRNISIRDQCFFGAVDLDERIDEQTGIIRDVKLVGLESENGYDYRQALPSAPSLFENAPVFWKPHREDDEETRDDSEILAFVKNVRYVDSDGLRGDLHFFTTDPRYPKVIEYIRRFTDQIGLSQDTKGSGYRDETTGLGIVQKFTKVNELVLTRNPAATTNLFDSKKGKRSMKNPTITQVVSKMKIGSLRRKLCFHLLEMADPSLGSEVVQAEDQDEPMEVSSPDAQKAALKQLVNAILDDDGLTAEAMAAKIKTAITSFAKIDEAGAGGGAGSSSNQDEEDEEDSDKKKKAGSMQDEDEEEKDLKDSFKKLQSRLDKQEAKEEILELLDSEDIKPDKELVSELLAIPASMRKKYISRIKTSLQDSKTKKPKQSGSIIDYDDEEDEDLEGVSFLDRISN